MAAETMKDVLQSRLGEQRAELTERRGQLRDFLFMRMAFKGTIARVPDAERKLDQVQQALAAEPPDLNTATQRLGEVREALDQMDRAITFSTKSMEAGLALWGILVLLVSAVWMVDLWQQKGYGDPPHFDPFRLFWWTPSGGNAKVWPHLRVMLDPKSEWSLLRSALLAAGGGLAGAALQIGRVLYLAIPSRTLNPRSVLWYYFSPFFAAALAVTIFLVIRAGFFGVGGGSTPTVSTSAAAIALGILVGFEPTAVFERIKAVIKAFFGTDEVRGPRIAPPQVQVTDGRIRIAAAVTSSAATRIVSVTALLQSDGFTATLALQRGADYAWSTECPLPTGLADKKSATVVIEARDEATNVNRSEPIAVTLTPGAAPVDTPPAAPGVKSSTPVEGGTLGANDPIVVTFNTPMEDADPALTGPEDASIEVTKAWSEGNTVLTLAHAPLAAGAYLLVLENALLPDGTELEPAWQLQFSVAPTPAPSPP